LQAGLILTVGSISWSWTSVWIARYANSPKSLSYLGSLTLGLGLALILATVYLGGPIFLIYFAWFLAGTGMGLMVPTFNTLSLDVADQYPSGTAASALLLALTWGFAIGAPAMGIAANFGFALGFVPEDLGNGILPPLSLQALRLGGSYAILACLILVLFSIFVAQRMPARRER
jgi:MFS family permease